MLCDGCDKPVEQSTDHEFCHIILRPTTKSYEEYRKESQANDQSIFNKYGAPQEARAPMYRPSSEKHQIVYDG